MLAQGTKIERNASLSQAHSRKRYHSILPDANLPTMSKLLADKSTQRANDQDRYSYCGCRGRTRNLTERLEGRTVGTPACTTCRTTGQRRGHS